MEDKILDSAINNQWAFATAIALIAFFVLVWYGLPKLIALMGRDRELELDTIALSNKAHEALINRLDAIEADAKDLRAEKEQIRKDLDKCKDDSAQVTAQAVATANENWQKNYNALEMELDETKQRLTTVENQLLTTKQMLDQETAKYRAEKQRRIDAENKAHKAELEAMRLDGLAKKHEAIALERQHTIATLTDLLKQRAVLASNNDKKTSTALAVIPKSELDKPLG